MSNNDIPATAEDLAKQMYGSKSTLVLRNIAGRTVDKEYEYQLRRQNKVILVAILLSCAIFNIPMGLLALLCLFISNKKYNQGRFLKGLGWSHGALALCALGTIFTIGLWICFISWFAAGYYPWDANDADIN